MAGNALYFGNAAVDYAALVGIHRFEGYLSALLDDLCGGALRKGFQGLAALVAVAVAVDGDAAVGFLGAVACEYSQVLQAVKGLAASADDYAQLIAGDVKNNVSIAADSVYLEVFKSQCVEHVCEVLLRSLYFCAALDVEILGKFRDILLAFVLKGSGSGFLGGLLGGDLLSGSGGLCGRFRSCILRNCWSLV